MQEDMLKKAGLSFCVVVLMLLSFVFPKSEHYPQVAQVGNTSSTTATTATTVTEAPTAPTLVFTTNQTSLTWSTSYASTCVASGGWTGTKDIAGTEPKVPDVTTTYTLSCTGPGGSISNSVQILVAAPISSTTVSSTTSTASSTVVYARPSISIITSPKIIEEGETSRITWRATDATSCVASRGWSGEIGPTGSVEVSPSVTTTFTLKCSGPGGTTSDSKSITVAPAEDDPSSEDSNDSEDVSSSNNVPSITVSLSNASNISGTVDISFNASNANGIDVYLYPVNSETPQFLGTAIKSSSSKWKYVWNSFNTPNGSYELYATAKNQEGSRDSNFLPIVVNNTSKIEHTPAEVAHIDAIKKVNESMVHVTESRVPSPKVVIQRTLTEKKSTQKVQNLTATNTIYVLPVDLFISEIKPQEAPKGTIETVLTSFRYKLDLKLDELKKAVRSGDEKKKSEIQTDIESIKDEAVSNLPETNVTATTTAYIDSVTNDLQTATLKNEEILKEKNLATLDSDADGLSDFDEINTYATDPFSVDSDADSFIDSAEISSGFDPNNSKTQAVVTYESPQHNGEFKSDLFSVQLVRTFIDKATTTSSTSVKALISGKGLPNSFVTLYIFSTPIVVTVKTDETGLWTYILEKELEEGNHKVYVGITDNSGKIVAKSNPFIFVKSAEAYTPLDIVDFTVPEDVETNDLFIRNGLLLALMFVFVFIFLNIQERKRLAEIAAKPKVAIRYPYQ